MTEQEPSSGLRMTIDSNVVLGAFERVERPDADEVDRACRKLIDMHPGQVVLQVAVRTPQWKTKGWAQELKRRGIESLPSIVRLDVSYPGKNVFLAGDEDVRVLARLYEILPTSSGNRDRFRNRVIDVDVVHHHMRWGGDYLVTNDSQILDARTALEDEFAVLVLDPVLAVERIKA